MRQLWSDVVPELGAACSADDVGDAAGGFRVLLRALARSEAFLGLWAGRSRGPFVLPASGLVRGALSLRDIVQGLATSTGPGRCKPCESALTLTDGGDFRCPISIPPIKTEEELREVLQYGTVFLNTASLHWKALAEICLAASEALHFPTNINVYVTGRGRRVSTDVHTDNHDVMIFQTQGAKHWRVYPPPARRSEMAHPLYRGKNEDKLLEEELSEPLLDVVLRPGEMLFVPMGFPHFTGTADVEESEVSVHLTLGISTADYGLSLGSLRQALLVQLGEDAELDEPSLPDAAFWSLWSPVPVGPLLPESVRRAPDPAAALLQHVMQELLAALQAVEPERWEGLDEAALLLVVEPLVAAHLARQLVALNSQEEAYREVAAAPDGIFLTLGPRDSASEYRRAMLEHQAREDERKRRRADPRDENFIKRSDPADGVARSKPELRELYGRRGATAEEVEDYWQCKCRQLYPNDQPPAELIDELERAGQSWEALMHFLGKRMPSLHTEQQQVPRPSHLEQLLSALAATAATAAPTASEALEEEDVEDGQQEGGAGCMRSLAAGALGARQEARQEACPGRCSERWAEVEEWVAVD